MYSCTVRPLKTLTPRSLFLAAPTTYNSPCTPLTTVRRLDVTSPQSARVSRDGAARRGATRSTGRPERCGPSPLYIIDMAANRRTFASRPCRHRRRAHFEHYYHGQICDSRRSTLDACMRVYDTESATRCDLNRFSVKSLGDTVLWYLSSRSNNNLIVSTETTNAEQCTL